MDVPDSRLDGAAPGDAGGAGHAPGRPTRGEVIEQGVTTASRWSLQLLLVVAALVLLGLLVVALWSIVFPIFLGLVVATVLEPPVSRLRRRGLPPALAAALVMVVGLGLVGGIVAMLVPVVSAQIPAIAQGAVGGLGQIQEWLTGPPFNLGESQIGDYVEAALAQLQQSAGQIAGGVVTGVTVVASGLITVVLSLVLAFLFAKDGPRFLPWLRRSMGEGAGRHLEQVCRRSWDRLGGFIRSQALIGLVDATFIGIGLVLFGVPLALPLAVLVFFGAFIPIIGALVTGALAVLVALVVQGPAVALGVLILIVAVQQLEGNLLQPVVQGRGLGLNAAVVILAVTAGSNLAGIAGAFVAVPLAAVVAEIARYVGEEIDARTGDPGPPQTASGAPAFLTRLGRLFRRRPAADAPSTAGDTVDPEGADGADHDGADHDGARPGSGGSR